MAIKKKSAKKSAPKSIKKAKPAPKKVVKAVKKAKAAPTPKKKAVKVIAIKKAVKKVTKKANVTKPLKAKSVAITPKKAVKSTIQVQKIQKATVTKPMAKKVQETPTPKAIKAKIVNKVPKIEVKQDVKMIPEAKVIVPPKAEMAKPAPVKPKVVDNRLRYNDKELQEFRELIVQKIESTKSELKYYQDQVKRTGDNSTDDTENRYSSEDGIGAMEREHYMQMASRLYQYIDHLEKAIIRIENKTYGICRVTGKLIDKDRLRAVPHATLSLEAKLTQKKETANIHTPVMPETDRIVEETERTPEE